MKRWCVGPVAFATACALASCSTANDTVATETLHVRDWLETVSADGELMAAVSRGEYAINGFRNRDVRARLHAPTSDKRKAHQQMAAVGRKLRLLRGHGLIVKVAKTHRYVVTEKGRRIMTALLAARQASTEKLTAMAA